jgi:hypothetical protein
VPTAKATTTGAPAAATDNPPSASANATPPSDPKRPPRTHKYITWHDLLRRTFAVDVTCRRCQGALRLIALARDRTIIATILGAMGLPTSRRRLLLPARRLGGKS